MLTYTQAKTAQSIVNIFETGSVRGDYSKVTLIPGDSGHLTYGRSQTTLGSGNLFLLLQRYCSNSGARFGGLLSAYLDRFSQTDLSLDEDYHLHNLLRASADDLVMRETQDGFFDEVYWQPAVRAAERTGISSALGIAVVYDGLVHGSWVMIRNRTNEQAGLLADLGESEWIRAYVNIRRDWLASHYRADLRATVYRMDAFQRLINSGYWGLELPLVVRGLEISAETLSATPKGCYIGPQSGSRILAVEAPLLKGMDVRLLQLALSGKGMDILADGIYGKVSSDCVRQYQLRTGFPATGIADNTLFSTLLTT